MGMLRALGPDTHVVAVCQPGPLVLRSGVADMQGRRSVSPATMTIMGSPIDARKSPHRAKQTRRNARSWIGQAEHDPYGAARFIRAHSGASIRAFCSLASFMGMNLAPRRCAPRLFQNLAKGDGDSTEKHRDFYDEYLAVMDL